MTGQPFGWGRVDFIQRAGQPPTDAGAGRKSTFVEIFITISRFNYYAKETAVLCCEIE